MSGPGLRTPPADHLLGVDVGFPQGDRVDWQALVDGGCSFAILRGAGGSAGEDPTFQRNATECVRLGIPFGVYGVHKALGDGAAEARHLLDVAGGYPAQLGFWCDWELSAGAGPLQLFAAVGTWCDAVEAAGELAGIYTGPSFVEVLDKLDGFPGPHPLLRALAPRPLWLAHYTGSFDRPPRTPAPWMAWRLWQASGNHFVAGKLCSPNYSTIPGTSTEIDANLFEGSLSELLAPMARPASPAAQRPA